MMADHATDPHQIDGSTPTWGVLSRSFNLLPGAIGKDNGYGPWIDARILARFSCQVYGSIGGGSVQLFASNDLDPAGNNDNGFAIGTAFNAIGMQRIEGPYRFVRAQISGATEPNLKAVLHGTA